MDKLIDAFCKWEPFGQGLFLLLIAILVVSGLVNICKLGVVLFRGWPPACCEEDDDCCTDKKGTA